MIVPIKHIQFLSGIVIAENNLETAKKHFTNMLHHKYKKNTNRTRLIRYEECKNL